MILLQITNWKKKLLFSAFLSQTISRNANTMESVRFFDRSCVCVFFMCVYLTEGRFCCVVLGRTADKVSILVDWDMGGVQAYFDTGIRPLFLGLVEAFTTATADLDEDVPEKPDRPPSPVPMICRTPTPEPDIILMSPLETSPPPRNIDLTIASIPDIEKELQEQGQLLNELK